MAVKQGLLLDAGKLVTAAQGQVLGLGKGVVQAILKDYGIPKVLAAVGGRTSRGSMGNMQDYVAFLNKQATRPGFDIKVVESWWVDRVRDFFESSPLKLKVDTGSTLKACLVGIFEEAKAKTVVQPFLEPSCSISSARNSKCSIRIKPSNTAAIR